MGDADQKSALHIEAGSGKLWNVAPPRRRETSSPASTLVAANCSKSSRTYPLYRINTEFDTDSWIFLYVSDASQPGAIPVVLPKTPPIIGVTLRYKVLADAEVITCP